MRAWQRAAIVVATVMTHVVPASAEALAPAGLDGGADTGGVPSAVIQPGSRLDGVYYTSEPASAPVAQKAPKLRRIGRMMDFFPAAGGTGFHLSAGMRMHSPTGGGLFNPFRAARATSAIYAPAMSALVPLRSGLRRTAPVMAVGWSHPLGQRVTIGVDAGTSFDRGGGHALGAMPARAWSRIDPIAQASFALRF